MGLAPGRVAQPEQSSFTQYCPCQALPHPLCSPEGSVSQQTHYLKCFLLGGETGKDSCPYPALIHHPCELWDRISSEKMGQLTTLWFQKQPTGNQSYDEYAMIFFVVVFKGGVDSSMITHPVTRKSLVFSPVVLCLRAVSHQLPRWR